MSVGVALAKSDTDNTIASLGRQLNNVFFQIQKFNAKVIAIGSTALQAAPFGYTSGEANTLLAAASDLDKFRQVYAGLMFVTAGATQNTGVPTVNDGTHFGYPFSINVDQCDGFGY